MKSAKLASFAETTNLIVVFQEFVAIFVELAHVIAVGPPPDREFRLPGKRYTSMRSSEAPLFRCPTRNRNKRLIVVAHPEQRHVVIGAYAACYAACYAPCIVVAPH